MRVNPVGTPDHELDLIALDGTHYSRLMLSKCESAEDVLSLAPADVVALVESPRGALAVADIALAANAIGVMWGAEDLVAGLGGNSSRHPNGSYRDVCQACPIDVSPGREELRPVGCRFRVPRHQGPRRPGRRVR